jgi:hypothetical protein
MGASRSCLMGETMALQVVGRTMARQGRRRARPHGEHAPEAPGERMAAFREHVAWWKLTAFVYFMLWLGALTWADSHGRDGASSWLMMLVGVVVVALSSVLWVRTHPKRLAVAFHLV